MLIYVRVFLHHLSCMCHYSERAPHVGAPTESESVMYGVYTMIRKGLHVASPL